MPRGSHHDETGLLLEQDGQLGLDRADGGTWRLDAGWRMRRHLGRRVRVVGVRDGFDLLSVEQMRIV
ncbi:DUF5818 domain-containing protein [uncultured Sphingomonas sp.]|uniref:DUF5818 domain-containing protein n=1 Tax=uncultured Sphingomonas sp. TaxID=158754 RepID=UPI00157508F8